MDKVIDKLIRFKLDYIAAYEEVQELENSKEVKEADLITKNLLDNLKKEVSPEVYNLIDNLLTAQNNIIVSYRDYYFKKGVLAGLTDLSFLKQLENILKKPKEGLKYGNNAK